MADYTDSGLKTFVAAGALPLHSRVKVTVAGDPPTVAAAGIADIDIGVTEREAFAAGDLIPVRLRSAQGTHKAIAAAAIAIGAPVYTAASGKVSVSASTAYRRGFALDVAGANGDIIEIVPFDGEVAVA